MLKKERLLEVFTGSDALISAAVVVLGFLAATLIILAIGRNPAGMYEYSWAFWRQP